MSEVTLSVTNKISPEEAARIEGEHGPVVFLSHPDGSLFGFKRLTGDEYQTRQNRIKRGQIDPNPDEQMLQLAAVYPSREAWNAYVGSSVFEVSVYVAAYREAHGGSDVHVADPDEIPSGEDAALWLSNNAYVFGFRRPGRADVKQFQAALVLEREGGGQKPAPGERARGALETLLRNTAASPAFGAWLDQNLFGINAFGEAYLTAFGVRDVQRVSGN